MYYVSKEVKNGSYTARGLNGGFICCVFPLFSQKEKQLPEIECNCLILKVGAK